MLIMHLWQIQALIVIFKKKFFYSLWFISIFDGKQQTDTFDDNNLVWLLIDSPYLTRQGLDSHNIKCRHHKRLLCCD